MKNFLHAFAMCQSMFCSLPCPWKIWDEEARDKMLLFLPVVGLEIGAIWAALAWATALLNLPPLVRGLFLCAAPVVLTGFIHLDGFMDVTDAVRSCRDLDRRREILKDSHTGAFAVIGIVLLLMAQFAFLSSAPASTNPLVFIFIPAVSRCCSSLAVTILRPMSTSQYLHQTKPKSHIWILGIMLCVFTACSFLLCGKCGFTVIGCLAGYCLALRRGYKSLDGMSGDISGYAITIGELCAVAVYALI